jgi:hypothetical protein
MLEGRKTEPGTNTDPDFNQAEQSQTVSCDPDLDRFAEGPGDDTHWAEFGNDFTNPNVCD